MLPPTFLGLVTFLLSSISALAQSNPEGWGSMIIKREDTPSDIVTFDDMPSCARKQCTPYQAQKLGCLKDLTRDCFCANMESVINNCKDIGYWCNDKENFLGRAWASSVCLGFALDSINSLPTCAQGCIEPSVIRASCALSTFDCFCQAELPTSCLEKCASADAVTANRWRASVCANSPTMKSDQTYTIPAQVKTVTESGKERIETVKPQETQVVNGNTNANSQNININTGGNGNGVEGVRVPGVLALGAAMGAVAVGMGVLV